MTDHEISEDEIQAFAKGALERACPLTKLRESWGDRSTWQQVWDQLAVVGFFEVFSAGGGDIGQIAPIHRFIVLEECGYAALPGPTWATMGAIGPLLEASGKDLDDWLGSALRAIAKGRGQVGVLFDGTGLVDNAASCELFINLTDRAVFAVRDDNVEIGPSIETWDGARSVSPVSALGTAAVEIGEKRLHEQFMNALRLTTAFLLNGLSRRVQDMTVEYVRERVQFGRAIGTFQAVQHGLADAHTELELSRAAARAAARNDTAADRPAPAIAHRLAIAAAQHSGRIALQYHGAAGFTWEYDLHMFLKRAMELEHAVPHSPTSTQATGA